MHLHQTSEAIAYLCYLELRQRGARGPIYIIRFSHLSDFEFVKLFEWTEQTTDRVTDMSVHRRDTMLNDAIALGLSGVRIKINCCICEFQVQRLDSWISIIHNSGWINAHCFSLVKLRFFVFFVCTTTTILWWKRTSSIRGPYQITAVNMNSKPYINAAW